MVSPGTATGPRRRGAMFLRGLGFVVAIALGGLAIWLIATSGTVKAQRVGALAGMWGVLIGAYSIFGARRHEEAMADPGTALELRQNAAIARSEDVAAQREFQARLEALLRREVQEGVSRELAGLRNEVSQLRNEILEKVGGQLRMERTETTRLFGSNLEALQREVRLLKVAQLGDTGTISTIDVAAYETTFTEPVRSSEPFRMPEPAQAPDGANGAFPPFRPLQPARAFSTPGSQSPAPPMPSEPLPYVPLAPEPVAPVAPPAPVVPPAPSVADSAPFQPYVIPPATNESAPLPPYVPPPAPAAPAVTPPASWATHLASPPPPSFATVPEPTVPILPMNSAPLPSEPVPSTPLFHAAAAATPPVSAPVSYPSDPFSDMPRIRPFTDFELDATDRPAAASWQPGSSVPDPGRHANGAIESPNQGGRRRRTDDSDNDVLAQILAREKVDPPT